MNKKRIYALLPAILFCTLVFSQHPHSRGGSPFYWALVGAISYGGLYIIYILFSYLVKHAKRNKIKEHSSNIVQNTETTLQSSDTLEETEKKEMVDSTQEDVPNKKEMKLVYCRFCGMQIDESDVFCPRCGEKQNINKASRNVESLSSMAKTFFQKLFALIRIPYDYTKKKMAIQISKEQTNQWRRRIKRIGIILLAVAVVAIILAGGAWGVSYYYDEYIPKKQLDEACEDVIKKFRSSDKTISLEYSRKILLSEGAFGNSKEDWGYDEVSNSSITKRMRQYRDEAFKKIEVEAYNGNPQMQYLLGRIYIGRLINWWYDDAYGNPIQKREYAVNPDTIKAVYWWNEAAKQGYILAYNCMGIAYKFGYGVNIDMKKAIDYFKKGAELGDANAQCNYGDLFRDGVKIHTGSHVVKVPQYIYGNYYGTEDVTIQDSMILLSKDIEQAKSWWAKSAAQGNAFAKERLQKIYE